MNDTMNQKISKLGGHMERIGKEHRTKEVCEEEKTMEKEVNRELQNAKLEFLDRDQLTDLWKD